MATASDAGRKNMAMDVMMMLEGEALTQVYTVFKEKNDREDGSGLSQTEFVSAVLKYLPRRYLQTLDKVDLVMQLSELFAQIDVNGDGELEWSEFTQFCVEAGVTTRSVPTADFSYKFDASYHDMVAHRGVIQAMLYEESTKEMIVVEGGSSEVKLFKSDLHSYRTLRTEENSTKLAKDAGAASCVSVEVCRSRRALAVSQSNHVISVWAMDTFAFIGALPCHSNPQVMCWCPSAELLFVGFTNGDIRGYSLTELRLMVQIKKHTDIVLSLVYIPKHDVLVSSSVDPHVYAWDCSGTDYRLKASLQGSDTGIRKMVYGSRSDVIVGAGFQFSGLVWDASSNRLLMKLVGHRATIIDVAILKTTPERIVTIDSSSVIKIWDATDSLMGMAFCIMTLEQPVQSTVHHLQVMDNFDIVLAGMKMSRFSLEMQVRYEVPVCTLYNSVFRSIITISGRSIRMWSAVDGSITKEFKLIASSDVTAACLDDRQRKIIVGTQSGSIEVFNCVNGAYMKPGVSHAKEITAMRYCKEDRCVLSVGWDCNIMLQDEAPQDSLLLLRSMAHSHNFDINVCEFSYPLGLVFTGSKDCLLKVWDFQNMKPTGVCIGHTAEITAIVTLDSLPVVVSADANGIICIWAVRGYLSPYRMLYKYQHSRTDVVYTHRSPKRRDMKFAAPEARVLLQQSHRTMGRLLAMQSSSNRSGRWRSVASPTGGGAPAGAGSGAGAAGLSKASFMTEPGGGSAAADSKLDFDVKHVQVNVGITCMQSVADLAKGEFVLYVADEYGDVTILDLQPIIERLGIEPLALSRQPPQLPSYSAHRRFSHVADDYLDPAREREGTASMFSRRTPAPEPREEGVRRGRRAASPRPEPRPSTSDLGGLPSSEPLPCRDGDVVTLHKFRAHMCGIRHITVVTGSPECVITTGEDNTVKVYSFPGELLGVLDSPSRASSTGSLSGTSEVPWKLHIPIEEITAAEKAAARSVMEAVERMESEEDSDSPPRPTRRSLLTKAAGPGPGSPHVAALPSTLSLGLRSEGGPGSMLLQDSEALDDGDHVEDPTSELRFQIVSQAMKDVIEETEPAMLEPEDFNQLNAGEGSSALHDLADDDYDAMGHGPPTVPDIISRYSYMGREKARSKLRREKEEEVDLEPSEFLKSRLGLSSFGSRSTARDRRSASALGTATLRSASGMASSADLTEGSFGGASRAGRPGRGALRPLAASGTLLLKSAGTMSSTGILREARRAGHGAQPSLGPRNLVTTTRVVNPEKDKMMATIDRIISGDADADLERRGSRRTSIQDNFNAFLNEPRHSKAKLDRPMTVARRHSVTQDFGPYSLAEVVRVKHIFDSFDTDMSGSVLLKEFITCAAWRQMYSSERIKAMFSAMDLDKSGDVTFVEVLQAVFPVASRQQIKNMLAYNAKTSPVAKKKAAPELTEAMIAEMKQVFRAYDSNNDGKLSFDEIVAASTVAEGGTNVWSASDLEAVLKKHDVNSDALLDADEFVSMLQDVWVETTVRSPG